MQPEIKVESVVNNLITELVEVRASKKALEDQAGEMEKSIRNLQGKIIDTLKELGLKTFDGTRGKVTPYDRTSYKLPDTEEKAELLRQWLEAKGLRSMLKPNSISFNSLAAKEYELAKEKGDPFFEIPGVGQPLVTTILSLTGTKG